ncbi:beta-galactoside alpha-2,6-sialyltransferase 2-like isoform X1 [Branchiostoma floridae]|uniref:Beta-galactoside alpha-2,6-sialyltransferase 1 n=3 Tax=Branchiostoma floridae TaxID=7739 RepID=A0A9J7LE05_BRAFL|nr:beta-galactoside alpha-2,6-sialyltransferase 2-like isoform X1 [Branchiostoma floridae]
MYFSRNTDFVAQLLLNLRYRRLRTSHLVIFNFVIHLPGMFTPMWSKRARLVFFYLCVILVLTFIFVHFLFNGNRFQVTFRHKKVAIAVTRAKYMPLSKHDLLCELKNRVWFKTLPSTEGPFKALNYSLLEPKNTLYQLHHDGFKTCAAVMNSAAILGSNLGEEIDSHDAVMRFNNAPLSEEYRADIGVKTTLRLMNSQLLADPSFNFFTDPIYRNITMIVWDPAAYTGDMEEWYQNPDANFFSSYEQRRRMFPRENLYITDPRFYWELWDVLQENTEAMIHPNPPSSGFQGIAVMLSLCDQLDVYEFVPSERISMKCHYYEKWKLNPACTLGWWHDLRAEKYFILRMNQGTKDDITKKGKVTLSGYRANDCKATSHAPALTSLNRGLQLPSRN